MNIDESYNIVSKHIRLNGSNEQSDIVIPNLEYLFAEVKRLREKNHQQWLRIQELNGEINVWKKGDEKE